MERLKIFAGSSCPELGREVCRQLGVPLYPTKIYHYRTGCFETALEENVRGCRVFILQTSIPDPNLLHTHLWELFELVNAARKASAAEVTVVMPYVSYARSDKKWRGRMGIAATILAAFLERAGIDRMVGIDFHSPAFEDSFDPRTVVDDLTARPLIVKYLAGKFREEGVSKEEVLVLPGDTGHYDEAKKIANLLGVSVGNVKKRRIDRDRVEIEAIEGYFEDAILVVIDDELCTGGTARAVINFIEKLGGAKNAFLVFTHALCQGEAVANLSHPLIKEIAVTDTVPLPQEIKKVLPITLISVAPLLASAIKEIYEQGSVSKLFKMDPIDY